MLLLYLFEDKIIGIGLWLITQLFKVAAGAFKVFMLLAQNDVLSEIDYSKLLTNFYVIIGITMLFIMAFALLRGIVNPDDQKQGTTAVKNIIINFVLSCIMLGFLPTVFPFMFDLQDAILRYNVIGGFFGYGQVGKPLTDNTNVSDVEVGAYRLTNGVFTAFFNVSEGYCNDALNGQTFATKAQELAACQESLKTESKLIADGDNHNESVDFLSFIDHVDETGDFSVYSAFIDQAADNNINFNFIVLLIAGCALIYVGISYCFDMGLRLIKLIFYQVLAPIPIFLRVIPNSKFSGTFNQWLKVTLTCWMEVFVRIFIFSFCMWLCKEIMATDFLSSKVYEYGKLTGLFTQAFILMAIVMFMKRSPKLLSEITGIDSGNMKLGIKDKLAEGGGFAAGAAVGGGLTAGIRNLASSYEKDENGKWHKKDGARPFRSTLAGIASGGARAGKAGWTAKTYGDVKKAASAGATGAVEKRAKRANYKAAHGGTLFGATMGHITDAARSARNYVFDQSVEGLSRESQSMSQIVSAYSSHGDHLESLMESEQAKGKKSIFYNDKEHPENNHGFSQAVYDAYEKYDRLAQELREKRAKFNAGDASVSKEDLRDIEGRFAGAKDDMRDQLANLTFQGNQSADYKALDAKAQAAMQTGMTDAEKLQATILANANSRPVQMILGEEGNDVLNKILDKNQSLTADDFEFVDKTTGKKYKLKDMANIYKGQADIKIAEMNKENAAKGDKK